jgi:transposase
MAPRPVMLLNGVPTGGDRDKSLPPRRQNDVAMAANGAATSVFQELAVGPAIDARADLELTGAECQQLQRWIRSPTTPHRLVVRSRIVLLASEGASVREICHRIHTRPAAVRLWCERFERGGLSAIQRDAPGRGRRPGTTTDTIIRVLAAMASPPASGRWTARSLGRRAGVSAATVWRVWQRVGLTSESTAQEVAAALMRGRSNGGAANS